MTGRPHPGPGPAWGGSPRGGAVAHPGTSIQASALGDRRRLSSGDNECKVPMSLGTANVTTAALPALFTGIALVVAAPFLFRWDDWFRGFVERFWGFRESSQG